MGRGEYAGVKVYHTCMENPLRIGKAAQVIFWFQRVQKAHIVLILIYCIIVSIVFTFLFKICHVVHKCNKGAKRVNVYRMHRDKCIECAVLPVVLCAMNKPLKSFVISRAYSRLWASSFGDITTECRKWRRVHVKPHSLQCRNNQYPQGPCFKPTALTPSLYGRYLHQLYRLFPDIGLILLIHKQNTPNVFWCSWNNNCCLRSKLLRWSWDSPKPEDWSREVKPGYHNSPMTRHESLLPVQ